MNPTTSMKPIYESEWATVYHGPAEALDLPKNSVDLLATDPPYGVSFRSNFGQNFDPILNDDGSYDPLATLAPLIAGPLRPSRHVYIFGPFDLKARADELRLSGFAELIWDKEILGLGNLTLPWGPQHEPIQFAVHARSKSDREKGRGRLAARLRHGSVLRVPRKNSSAVKRHPTEKPVLLMKQLIEASSVVGETVLDPYAGSGSTGVAAILTARKAILCELDEGYANLAVERIKKAERFIDAALTL